MFYLAIIALWVLHNLWYWNDWYEVLHPGWVVFGVPALLFVAALYQAWRNRKGPR